MVESGQTMAAWADTHAELAGFILVQLLLVIDMKMMNQNVGTKAWLTAAWDFGGRDCGDVRILLACEIYWKVVKT
jgi:hypothetical protein